MQNVRTKNEVVAGAVAGGLTHVVKASRYSVAGLVSCFRNETAFRIECILGIVHNVAAFTLPIGRPAALGLFFLWLLLLGAEVVNSAIEEVVDMVSPQWSESAKRAKDYGSAAVFIMIVAIAAGWMFALAGLLQLS